MNAETLVLEELKAGTKDLEWFSKNFSDIKKKYPKKFVAIKDQNVVVAASKIETLIKLLKEKFGNPNDFLIDFVPDDKYIEGFEKPLIETSLCS
jgi:hypothetical protein